MKDSKQTELFPQLSPGDSPAKTSQLPEKEKVYMLNGQGCGRRCFDSSEMYGRRGQLLKMYQPLDLKDLPWSYKISARSGICVSGIAYPLVVPPSVRLTKGTGFGLLPTPTTQEIEHPNAEICPKSGRRFSKDGKSTHSLNLADSVKMWPTPCANPRPSEGNVRILRNKVMAGEMTREEATAMLNGKDPFEAQGVLPKIDAMKSSTEITGQLNPTWVEWLMGYPTGWTDLSNSETP